MMTRISVVVLMTVLPVTGYLPRIVIRARSANRNFYRPRRRGMGRNYRMAPPHEADGVRGARKAIHWRSAVAPEGRPPGDGGGMNEPARRHA